LLTAREAEAAHQRHALDFLAFGEPFAFNLQFPYKSAFPTPEQLDLLERELDNLRTALRWWIELEDVERAIKQACILFHVWFWRGYLSEGHAWLREILALPSVRSAPNIRIRALPMFARLAIRHGEYVVALETFEELLATQQFAGDHVGAASTLIELANVRYLRAEYTAAWACLDASRSQGTDLRDHQLEGHWRNYASQTALCEGHYDAARTLAGEALAGYDTNHQPLAGAYCHMTLGNVDLEEGSYDEAKAHFSCGVEVALDYGDRTLLAHFIEGFAGLASVLGQHERSVRLGGAAEALREVAGAPIHPAWQQLTERQLVASHRALGTRAASEVWAAGKSLSLGKALEEVKCLSVPTCDDGAMDSTS